MAHHAVATFVIDTWEATDVTDVDGVSVSRTDLTKTFSGDLIGTSAGWMTMAGTPSGSAAYVGFERFAVALHGRRGTFLLRHNAMATEGGGDAVWDVLPGSGTGELSGLTGTAELERHDDGSHSFRLTYDLSEGAG